MSDNTAAIPTPLEHQPETNTHRVEYTDGSNPPSRVIPEAIEAIADVDTTDIPPLYDAIDPEALDSVFRPTPAGGYRGDGEVVFTYFGYEVSVRSYGIIEITPAE